MKGSVSVYSVCHILAQLGLELGFGRYLFILLYLPLILTLGPAGLPGTHLASKKWVLLIEEKQDS